MKPEKNDVGAGAAYLKPTVVQGSRALLDENGIASKPGDGAREILDRLFACIGSRIGEPGFRERLETLLGEIVEGGGFLPTPEAEILRQAEVSAMIGDIERALRPEGAASGHGLLERLQAPALCCMLLIAMTAGCDAEKDSRQVPPPSAKAAASPFDVNGKSVLDYVQRTNLPDWMKAKLSERLRGMASPERKEIIDLFRTKTPEEIVAHLERMAEAVYRKDGIPALSSDAPVYKGISFPARRA